MAKLFAAGAVLLPRIAHRAGSRPWGGAAVLTVAPARVFTALGAAVAQRSHRAILVAAGQRVWLELLQHAVHTLRAHLQPHSCEEEAA